MEGKVFLEHRLGEILDSLGISFVRQSSSGTSFSSLGAYLTIIKLKDEATYWHCVRVALCGVKVAEALNLDFKALFYAGLMHADIHGYYLLKGVYDFSAEIILRHRRYYSDGCPQNLPHSRVRYSEEAKKLIDRYARILAIIDFYEINKEDWHAGKNT